MDNIKKLERGLNVKDVQCKDCMYYYKYTTPMQGHCVRLNRHSSEVRDFCVKTGWYTEMCMFTAALEKELK